MIRPSYVALLLLLPAAAQAQGNESARFLVIVNGRDTVADERFQRDSAGFTGTLLRGMGATRQRIKYQVTEIGGTTPLIETGSWLASDPETVKARQNIRVIFKDDSVAVDEANDKGGVSTRLFETRKGAVPYLNLSTAFVEVATKRAAKQDSAAVALFNLNGGQTLTATVKRISPDSVTLGIGNIQFRFNVDRNGAILGGAVPSQNLVIVRGGVP